MDRSSIYSCQRGVVIDATDEVRFPLVWIIDCVMVVDDLRVEVDGR
jgi:hypothetical protein